MIGAVTYGHIVLGSMGEDLCVRKRERVGDTRFSYLLGYNDVDIYEYISAQSVHIYAWETDPETVYSPAESRNELTYTYNFISR